MAGEMRDEKLAAAERENERLKMKAEQHEKMLLACEPEASSADLPGSLLVLKSANQTLQGLLAAAERRAEELRALLRFEHECDEPGHCPDRDHATCPVCAALAPAPAPGEGA